MLDNIIRYGAVLTACVLTLGLVIASLGSGCSAEPFAGAVCTASAQMKLDIGVSLIYAGAALGVVVCIASVTEMLMAKFKTEQS